MDDNILKLKKRIESLSLKELSDMVWTNSKDYTIEALNFAKEELSKRGDDETIKRLLVEEEEKKQEDEKKQEEERKLNEKLKKQKLEEEIRQKKIKNDFPNIQGNKYEIKETQTNFRTDTNYKVVPFNPSDNVPDSLQGIIDREAVNGWKYVNHQYSDKLKPGSAGCFGIGATPDSTVHIGFVIFERK